MRVEGGDGQWGVPGVIYRAASAAPRSAILSCYVVSTCPHASATHGASGDSLDTCMDFSLHGTRLPAVVPCKPTHHVFAACIGVLEPVQLSSLAGNVTGGCAAAPAILTMNAASTMDYVYTFRYKVRGGKPG
eukprot:351909-Chlamydomonas_euryale.AAC.2